MPTLLDFRRRIRSVKNSQQITRAMKFVAAARLRRAQEAALAARPYAQELARVLRSTMARIQEPEHPLLERREEKTVLTIVLTGERGLAGAFNANILRKANEFFRANREKKVLTIPVGKKGRDALKKAGFTFAGEWVNVLARVEFKTAREIAKLATDLYAERKVDSVYIIFSEFKSVMAPNLTVQKLLPVEKIEEEKSQGKDGDKHGESGKNVETQVDYIYEQPEAQILDKLLPRYVETQILRAMLESSASEYAARMTAMESATKNAGEVIEALTLHMNKVRQAAITKEIIEIVSGAAYGSQ
ncbi:MAG TPA: ATP synthase F1 subunit gamma [Candidatus Saccharimonadales bacterium]|jgi:F-type H+-transporting ATPase subunit gamma|nr:ATP synthase F1 subunit gamma [Candidatus Saccharimonadales bacterium]